ncbi:MAG: hypothetical protein ACOYIP_01125 [Coriobacteriales bacterium]|jgi:hypothetical protein
MKKLKIISATACALALCLALAGCGSSEEPTDPATPPADTATTQADESASVEEVAPDSGDNSGDPALIVGRWDVYSIDNGDETLTLDDVDDSTREALAQQYIEIHEDGTLSMVDESQGFSQDCEWTFDGTDVVLSFEGNPLYTLTLDGDKLSMTAEGMTMTYQRA